MSISHKAIINQMIKQLERAKNDETDFLKHIYQVQGLCELIIEEGNFASQKKTDVNKNVMQILEDQTKIMSHPQLVEEDSIFDF